MFEALRQKTLVRILSDREADELSVFAVYPHRKFLPPKVRSFIDFLADRFRPEPYWDSHGTLKPEFDSTYRHGRLEARRGGAFAGSRNNAMYLGARPGSGLGQEA